jgi:hypothetical protein
MITEYGDPDPRRSDEPAPDTSVDMLLRLLAQKCESEELDYKEVYDVNNRRDLVKLAKTVGAMQALGGHIVIGADSNGRPSGRFTREIAEDFDEADLRQKLSKWIPKPVGIRLARHEHDGNLYVLIRVARRPPFCIFQANGQYTEPDGRQRTVFHAGDIYVRHGSSSEKAEQHDLTDLWEKYQTSAAPSHEHAPAVPAGHPSAGKDAAPATDIGPPDVRGAAWNLVMAVVRDVLVAEHDVPAAQVEPSAAFVDNLGLPEAAMIEVLIAVEDDLRDQLEDTTDWSVPQTVEELVDGLAARVRPASSM